MKKLLLTFISFLLGIVGIQAIMPLADELSENFYGPENQDLDSYIGIVRKADEIIGGKTQQYAVAFNNDTGQNMTIAITSPRMIDVARVAIPDASDQVVVNGGGLIDIGTSAPQIYYDKVDNFADTKVVQAVLNDGVVEDGTQERVLYALADTSLRLTATPDTLPISYFINQMKDEPMLVDSIAVDVNDKSVYANAILTFKNPNAFDTQKEITLKLNDFTDVNSLQEKRITIDTLKMKGYIIQLDRKTLVTLYMPGKVNGVAGTYMSLQINVKSVKDEAQESINRAIKEVVSLTKTGDLTNKTKEALVERQKLRYRRLPEKKDI